MNKKVLKPGFEKFRLWKKAYELMLKVHKICDELPRKEKYRIADQAERSSSSVVDNLAEAYCAYYFNNKIKLCYTARREAGETQNHLIKMTGKNYISEETKDALVHEYEGLIRGINAFINSLKQQRNNKK